jgi:hypothetical protein
MSDATTYFENTIAVLFMGLNTYVSLHTALPTAPNEVAGGAYARQPVDFTMAGSEPTVLSNDAIIEFPIATADWGNITHFAIWDAAVGGNMLIRKAVTVPKTILIGDVARFLVGELDVSIN